MAASTQSPSDLPTPPDAQLLSSSTDGSKRIDSMAGVKLPSLHSSILGPRMTTIAPSHVSSGPASVSSSHWSPGRSSDPHLYSISSQPYVYSTVKPYLSTSFQTSAERRGASGSNKQLDSRNAMDEDDDDVFGNTSQALGLMSAGEPSPPQLRRSNDIEREEGDAAGVFSFSSPCFGPRSLEAADIPPLSPPPADAHLRSQRLMSPSWTAATLGKLSLNGASPESSSSRRPTLGQSPRQASNLSNAHMSAIHSRSLPSNAGIGPSAHNRRLSFNRRQPAQVAAKTYHPTGTNGAAMLHPHSHFQRSASDARSRSRSRNRLSESSTPRSTMRQPVADMDDDETDEETMVMDQDMDDDDATEDEADQRTNRFKAQQSRHQQQQWMYGDASHTQARSIGSSAPLHRHSSGQPTTMSASFERANSGLNRQFSSDRYASGATPSHYGMGRHHPYAIGSTGASPSNAGVLSSYSPSNARVGMARRRSSIGNVAAPNGIKMASPQQSSHGMSQQLSHSPRYVATGRQSGPVYYEQQYHPHPGSLPGHSYQSQGYHYGESPDSTGVRRAPYAPSSGLNRQRGHGEQDEEEDEEEDEEVDEEEDEERDERNDAGSSTAKRKPGSRQSRAASHSRPSNPLHSGGGGGGGGGEVESSEMNEVSAIRERLGGAANCSAFISKLWYLMCRPELYSVSKRERKREGRAG